MSLLDYWETQRSSVKRRKAANDAGEESSSPQGERPTRWNGDATPASPLVNATDPSTPPTLDGEIPVDDEPPVPNSQTELESSLPAIATDHQVVAEYETSQAVGEDDDDVEPDLHERLQDGKWRKGKSSIYVDAFNLALQTVLDEEAHLFNEPEMEVFRQWKQLSYESQYLYASSVLCLSIRMCG